MARKRRPNSTATPRRRKSYRDVIVVALFAVAGGIGLWWTWGAQGAAGGTPRLTVDRTEIDLGYLRFGTRARAAFTLANAGSAPLEILEVSPVKALKGC